MRFILHNLILAPAIVAAAALVTNSAMAETTLKVPFSFTVEGKYCPAGLYSVVQDNTGSFVTLLSKNSPQSFTWVIGPGSPNPNDQKIAMRFDHSGQTHALQSIQVGSMITSRLDKKTRENKQMSDRLSQGR